jgi:hypothetical protein
MTVNMPDPAWKTREGTASTKPSSLLGTGFVEAARFTGGQPFVSSWRKIRA